MTRKALRRTRPPRSAFDGTTQSITQEDPRYSDAGDSLIEVLLAVMVLGISSVALLLGFGTTISGSAEYRGLATVDTVLRSVADEATSQMQQQPSTAWDTCTPQVVFSVPTGYSASIVSVTSWDGTEFAPGCSADQAEMITIQVNFENSTHQISTAVDDPLGRVITAGTVASKLIFVGQPGDAVAGATLSSPPQVAIEDNSNPSHLVLSDLSSVTLSISGGASLSQDCTDTGEEYAGVVTFSNCSVVTAGTYTLTATDGNLTPASSNSFHISAGPANDDASVVSVGSASVEADGITSDPITVTLLDAEGNPVPSANVSLTASGGNSTITTGTDPTNASGVATFGVTDATPESVTYTATDTTDAVTLSSTATVTFAAGPTAAISNPAASTIYSSTGTNVWSGTIRGTATATGGSAVKSTKVEIQATSGIHSGDYWNGATWQAAAVFEAATNGGNASSWSYGFAIPADGSYTVTAESTDIAGDVGSPVSVSTQFDSTPPVASAPIVNGHS